jgi:GNAT superfamily N-acetyltransferase
MIYQIAKLHIKALPDTFSSRRGVLFVASLYRVVEIFGSVRVIRRKGEIVGAISLMGKWILTLVVDPLWQHKGIGSKLVSDLHGRRYVYTQKQSVGFYEKMGFVRIAILGKTIFLWRK